MKTTAHWVHVESNDAVPPLVSEMIFSDAIGASFVAIEKFDGIKVIDYQHQWLTRANPESVLYDFRHFVPLNTTVHGKYHFPVEDDGLMAPDLCDIFPYRKEFDIAIQASAGAKYGRHWPFNPMALVKILRQRGKRVALIGSDPFFASGDDPDNFCGAATLSTSIAVIAKSKCYIGLSGFHNYWVCASNRALPVLNLHFPESPEHVRHYIHPKWQQQESYVRLQHGSLNEILTVLRDRRAL